MPIKNLLESLDLVLQKLDLKTGCWALTGSTNLYLQGVDVIPGDIDIISTCLGAAQIQNELQQYVSKPVSYCSLSRLRSNFGVFVVKNIKIEVFYDVQNYIHGKWEGHEQWEHNIIYIPYKYKKIPVLSLKYEADIYQKLEMYDRVLSILYTIKQQNSRNNK